MTQLSRLAERENDPEAWIKYSGFSYGGMDVVIWTTDQFREWGVSEKGVKPRALDQFNERSAIKIAKAAIRLGQFSFLFATKPVIKEEISNG